MELKPETIAYLKQLAAQEIPSDDPEFNVQDWSGGNYDDAFAMGQGEGMTHLAQVILEELGETWE